MAVAEKQKLRFGPFQVDLHSGKLFKNGTKLKPQPRPVQILSVLLEKPGELVTREELRQRIWPADTFVDSEQGLNTAIKKLRQALCDEATAPVMLVVSGTAISMLIDCA
jgi:DNA-binding winged helix-turn-helix (wHTH) protein